MCGDPRTNFVPAFLIDQPQGCEEFGLPFEGGVGWAVLIRGRCPRIRLGFASLGRESATSLRRWLQACLPAAKVGLAPLG